MILKRRAISNTLAPPLPANAAVLSTPARRLLLELELAPADRGGLAAAFTHDDLRAATGFERAALDRNSGSAGSI
jgi:hypothetical protein